jgi:8-amino-7-oxononanoate synthase
MKNRAFWKELVAAKTDQGLYRKTTEFTTAPGARVQVAGQGNEHINFVSNNYLDLAGHPRIAEAAAAAAARWGSGSGGSRLLGGSESYHQLFEEEFAAWKGYDRALVFNSGYTANVGLLSAFADKNTIVFSDRLNHASMVDGIRMSGARLQRYRHLDAEHLEQHLRNHQDAEKKVIITESVFSMDGDVAPLAAIAQLAEQYEALLIVDEAHAEGVLGPEGKGVVAELGLEEQVDVVMGTFGKAYGTFGAMVTCDAVLADYLVNYCRAWTYTTSLPAAVVESMRMAVEVSREEAWRRERVQEMGAQFREKLRADGWNLLQSETQIIPLVLGENNLAVKAMQDLRAQGFWVSAIREPTVPRGQARLRINLTAGHSDEDLLQLRQALQKWRQVNI